MLKCTFLMWKGNSSAHSRAVVDKESRGLLPWGIAACLYFQWSQRGGGHNWQPVTGGQGCCLSSPDAQESQHSRNAGLWAPRVPASTVVVEFGLSSQAWSLGERHWPSCFTPLYMCIIQIIVYFIGCLNLRYKGMWETFRATLILRAK